MLNLTPVTAATAIHDRNFREIASSSATHGHKPTNDATKKREASFRRRRRARAEKGKDRGEWRDEEDQREKAGKDR